MSGPRMVGEDPQAFVMHDGQSPFKVPKKGLSPSLEAKIRSMSAVESPPAKKAAPDDDFIDVGGYSVSYGTASPEEFAKAQTIAKQKQAAGKWTPNVEDPELTAQRNAEVQNGAVQPPWPAGSSKQLPIPTAQPTQFGNIGISPEKVAATDRLNAMTFADPAKTALDRAYSAAIPAPRTLNSNDAMGIDGRLPLGVRPEGSAAPMTPDVAPPPQLPVARGTRGGMGQPGAEDILAGFKQQKRGAEDLSDAAAMQGKIEGERLAAQGRALEIAALEDQDWRAKAAAKSADDVSRWQSAQDEMRNINTTVDPGRFWASRSTGGKISGIIGLALGALGAGPDGVNRAAMMMNQAIDRDIDAQKAEFSARLAKGKAGIDAASTMYGMSRQLFADETAARAATRASAYAMVENEAQKRLAAAKSPEDQARLQVMLGGIQQEIGKSKNEMRKASDTSALQWASLEGRGPSAASVKAAAEQKDSNTAHANMTGTVRELAALIKNTNVATERVGDKAARMQGLRADLLSQIKEARKLGTLDRGLLEYADQLIGDPNATFTTDASKLAKLQVLIDQSAKGLRNSGAGNPTPVSLSNPGER